MYGNALVADLVPEQLRGTAYGTYNAIIGILTFPASLLPGCFGREIGSGRDLVLLRLSVGGALALIATLLMVLWLPRVQAE